LTEVQRDLNEKGTTVEGFHTAFAAHQLAKKYRVPLPMVEEVYNVIFEGKNSKAAQEKIISLTK